MKVNNPLIVPKLIKISNRVDWDKWSKILNSLNYQYIHGGKISLWCPGIKMPFYLNCDKDMTVMYCKNIIK